MTGPSKLLNKNFVLLWQGQFVSNLGTQIALIALVFWIKHTTGSAALMGTIQMAVSLPAVLLGPIAGTFADRHSRKMIIVLSDLLRGFALVSLAATMFLLPQNTVFILIWLAAVFIFTGLLNSLFNPAISAAIPDIVPEDSVGRANSMGQSFFQLSVFFGQAVGGTLFRILGAPIVFLIDGLTFLFSAVSEMFITIPQNIRTHEKSQWRHHFAEFKKDTLAGFSYIWQKSGLRELVFISAFMSFFSMPIIVLFPFFVEDFLLLTADWYGYLIATYGIGSLLGYMVAGAVKISGKTRSRCMVGFILLGSIGYGLLGMTRNPLIALIMTFIGGGTRGFVTIHITTILQISTPSEIRGRVFALLGTISGALAPIAMGLAGIVADLIDQNIPLIYISCSAIMTVLSMIVLLNRKVRDFLAFEGQRPEPSEQLVDFMNPDGVDLLQGDVNQEKSHTYQETFSSWEKTFAENSGNDINWKRKGDILYDRGQLPEALAYYKKALELDPSGEHAWFRTGSLLNKLGRQQEAISAYDTVLRINMKNVDAWFNKAVILNHLGKLDESLDAYNNALQINSKDAQAWYNKGLVLHQLERLPEAIIAYDHSIEIAPEDSDTWYNKGIILYELNRPTEALDAFMAVVKLAPDDANAWNNIGVILSESGDYGKAIDAFKKSLKISHADDETWYNLGVALNKIGRDKEAKAAYEKAREINPKRDVTSV